MVWLLPHPRSSGGLSAVSSNIDNPAASASAAAGKRFATAVPELVTTAHIPSAPVPTPPPPPPPALSDVEDECALPPLPGPARAKPTA